MGQPLAPWLSRPKRARTTRQDEQELHPYDLQVAPNAAAVTVAGVDREAVRDIGVYYRVHGVAPRGTLCLARHRRHADSEPLRRRRTGLDWAARVGSNVYAPENDTNITAGSEASILARRPEGRFTETSTQPRYVGQDRSIEEYGHVRPRAVSVPAPTRTTESLTTTGEETFDGVAMVYCDTATGLCWEVATRPELSAPSPLDVFQLVLDVLTETVGTCTVTALRVHDVLAEQSGVRHGVAMLRDLAHHPLARVAVASTNASNPGSSHDHFVHPITQELIDIEC